MSGIVLRDYQREFVAAVEAALERGVRRQLGVLPTGAGKTVCFSELIRRRADAPVLVLAHRDELLAQAADKLRMVAPELSMSIGLVKAHSNQVNAPVVIASVQTLARRQRLKQLPRTFGSVIVDEAHHAAADSYVRILDYLDAELVLGVTATPERHDGKSLESVFDEIVYARSIEQMIEEGYLVAPRGVRLEVDVDLDSVRKSRGEFVADDLADALEAAGTPGEVLDVYRAHGEDRKALVFCPTVAMAHHMAEVFRVEGIAAEAVDGATPAEERAAILGRLRSGETQVLTNVAVLTEGFDEPSVSCVVLAAPTRSRAKYTQIIGRGLRLHPGKRDCLVIDVAGASEDQSIQSLPVLFGLDSLLDGETVIEARRREEAEAIQVEHGATEEEDREAAERAVRAERRRRNAESIRFFNRERMNWTTIDDRWTIPLDKERTIVLWPQRDGEQYDVLLVDREVEKFRFLARGLDLGYAQGAAEHTIRHHGNRLLADSQAPWRDDPVTNGQRRYLHRLGLPIPETRGEAADAITEAVMAETLRRVETAMLERITDERECMEV